MFQDLDVLWNKTLDILREELSETSFETWLKTTRLISCTDHKATIAVPNEFAKEWLETRYHHLIQDTLHLILNEEVNLNFITSDQESLYRDKPPKHVKNQNSLSTRLNPKYTFETFVIGNSNRFTHAASLAVAESPANAYNPLFIYGGVGLGKTHLMHAIGHFVLKKRQHRVVYVSSEKFTNELITSIRDDKTTDFRNKYRNIDVLLVDDIQFLAGKERTQEEFFHTFNALHEANKQIIISSDRPPKEIPTLEDRLRSRFEWGLITDIQPPDFETRLAILQKKASTENIELPYEILSYIATKINSNIRMLEGALLRVAAYASITDSQIDENFAAGILKDILPKAQPKPITISLIQAAVAKHFNLQPNELQAKKRTRAVAHPRQIAMYIARELTDYSLPKIGEEFGGRDHTTVMHACEKVSRDIKANPSLKQEIEEIIKAVKES